MRRENMRGRGDYPGGFPTPRGECSSPLSPFQLEGGRKQPRRLICRCTTQNTSNGIIQAAGPREGREVHLSGLAMTVGLEQRMSTLG
jgi:hypothetical protein